MTEQTAKQLLAELRGDVERIKTAPIFPAPSDVKAAVEKTFLILQHLIERAECDCE